MAIGSVIEEGSMIRVYDEKGKKLSYVQKGNGPKDGLQGYTSTTFSVREGNIIRTYDEKAKKLSYKQV